MVGRRYAGIVVAAAVFMSLGGCVASRPGSALQNANSSRYFPGTAEDSQMRDYLIGPFDKISVTVFQVKDLTVEEVQVDASGRILFPLIGSVEASGRTTSELSTEIAKRLGERYLVSPQVSVIVSESVTQKVTVEGSVTEAGVYELKGQTTLLQAIAMAKGPSRVASLPNVAIFRRVNGQRMAAVFDLSKIREGAMDDPQILGNDVVVVGLSNVKGVWREIVSALPAFAIFQPFGNSGR